MELIRLCALRQNTDDADDIRDVDLTKIHYLSGPIAVEGAEPGDALLVEILDVTPFPQVSVAPPEPSRSATDGAPTDALGLHWCL